MCRCVSLAFVFGHVALVCYIVSLSTTYWFDSQDVSKEIRSNTTSCHKGLFEICCPSEDCEYGPEFVYKTKEVQVYYRVSQYLFGFAGLNCLMAILLYYISLMSTKCYQSVCVSGWISAELAISALEGLIALILLATNTDRDRGFPDNLHIYLGWSIYVAMGAVVTVALAAFTNVAHNCKMHRANRQAQYEPI